MDEDTREYQKLFCPHCFEQIATYPIDKPIPAIDYEQHEPLVCIRNLLSKMWWQQRPTIDKQNPGGPGP